jgi:hypothetical protein
MRIAHHHPIGDDGAAILAALQDVESWQEWVPGLIAVACVPDPATPGGWDVQLLLRGPRELALRLLVAPMDEGVAFRLLQGDASSLSGDVRVNKDAIDWNAEAVWPVPVPGPLLVELRTEVLPRYSRALVMFAACQN